MGYAAQEVTWKTWTNDIKMLLLKSLFNEHSLNGNDSGPSHQSIRATREILNEFFPYTLGFGLVYEQEKVPDSYQMHKKRCPKPEPYQDCIYWTLLARLDVEKSIRKNRLFWDHRGKIFIQVLYQVHPAELPIIYL